MKHSSPLFPVFLLFSLAVLLPDASAQLFGKKKNEPVKLAPGQFEWNPQNAPSGPVLVVVNIDDQVMYLYRNAVLIGRSTVSTGRPGKETPTGVFTVLQKKVDHESSIYKGAKMPYMQRLTWSGIAMHAGDLPGYPASAGCVRLPLKFSEHLYSVTANGATVVITQKGATPSKSEKPASILFATQVAPGSEPVADPAGRVIWNPGKSREGGVNLLVSGADRTVYVYRNGILIGQSPVGILNPSAPLPSGVFLMLEGTEPGKNQVIPGKDLRPWAVISLEEQGLSANSVSELRQRLRLPKQFGKDLYKLMGPGSILVTTAESSTPDTHSAPGFRILTPEVIE